MKKIYLNIKTIYNTYKQMYPWPLNYILYINEYLFIKNNLESVKIWNRNKIEVNVCHKYSLSNSQ